MVEAVMPKRATPSSVDNLSPIIPEPTIVATSMQVPANSAIICRCISGYLNLVSRFVALAYIHPLNRRLCVSET